MASITRCSLIGLVLVALPVHAQLTGRVVSIADGDTLTLLDSEQRQHKIRLAGIDAPEKAQPFGQKSKASLSALVFQRVVEVVGSKQDRYGRTLGKVMAADPNCNVLACPKIHDVNQMQVMSGMAWWYRAYAKDQSPTDHKIYEDAESAASANRRRLWADENPVPPWDWRKH